MVTKQQIDLLNKERERYLAKAKEYGEAIYALTKICKHKWVDDGHDSHYRYSKCSICGKEAKV